MAMAVEVRLGSNDGLAAANAPRRPRLLRWLAVAMLPVVPLAVGLIAGRATQPAAWDLIEAAELLGANGSTLRDELAISSRPLLLKAPADIESPQWQAALQLAESRSAIGAGKTFVVTSIDTVSSQDLLTTLQPPTQRRRPFRLTAALMVAAAMCVAALIIGLTSFAAAALRGRRAARAAHRALQSTDAVVANPPTTSPPTVSPVVAEPARHRAAMPSQLPLSGGIASMPLPSPPLAAGHQVAKLTSDRASGSREVGRLVTCVSPLAAPGGYIRDADGVVRWAALDESSCRLLPGSNVWVSGTRALIVEKAAPSVQMEERSAP